MRRRTPHNTCISRLHERQEKAHISRLRGSEEKTLISRLRKVTIAHANQCREKKKIRSKYFESESVIKI